KVDSLRAGFAWNGSSLQPLLELNNVFFTLGPHTTHYDKLDLTNAQSVASDASQAVVDLIKSYLGSAGPGSHLAALAGIIPPANDPGSPNTILSHLPEFLANQTQEIGAIP